MFLNILVCFRRVLLYRQNKHTSRSNKCKYEAILFLDIITSHIGQLYGNLSWEDSGPATYMRYNIFAVETKKVLHCPSVVT